MSTPDALRLADAIEKPELVPALYWGSAQVAGIPEQIAAELRRQHAEIERMRADAARYRWLAQDGERIGERIRAMLDKWDGCDGKAGFDAAIDAAMRDAP